MKFALGSRRRQGVRKRLRPQHPWPIVLIVALAAIVRLGMIDRDALWLDEGYSWWDAHQSLASLWSLVPLCDPHPPLYFALLHGWIALLGDGTIAMRMLSTLLGVTTIFVVWLAGRELDVARQGDDGRLRIAPFAALLFALTPFQIYFSVEARPYALLCFGAALLTLGTLRIVRSIAPATARERVPRDTLFSPRPSLGPSLRLFAAPISLSGWLFLVAGATIVVWTHNTSVLLLGAVATGFIGLWIFDRSTRQSMGALLAAGLTVALLWAPDLSLLILQMREVSEDFWIPAPNIEGFTFELHYLLGLDTIGAVWWMVLAMLGGLVLIGRRIGWRVAATVAALALLPIVFNVAVSASIKPVLIARALIGATPAITLGLAAAAMLLRPRWLRHAATVAMIVVHAIAAGALLRADHVKEPWKKVVVQLASLPRDTAVLVVPNELALPLEHEAEAQHVTVRMRGVPADYPAIGMGARYPSGKCAPSVVGQDLTLLVGALRAESAVVLLTRRNNTYDPDEAIAAALRAAGFRLQRDDVFQPGDLRLMRFTRSAP